MDHIYIEEIEDTSNGEKTVYVFETEEEALKETCNDILNSMSRSWDFTSPDDRIKAQEIQDHIKLGNYDIAICDYNDYCGACYSESVYYSVREKDFISVLKNYSFSYIDFSPWEVQEDKEESSDIKDQVLDFSKPFTAQHPGAICRGPCRNYSPDAYADRCDNTYECYQCRMMKQVFGG